MMTGRKSMEPFCKQMELEAQGHSFAPTCLVCGKDEEYRQYYNEQCLFMDTVCKCETHFEDWQARQTSFSLSGREVLVLLGYLWDAAYDHKVTMSDSMQQVFYRALDMLPRYNTFVEDWALSDRQQQFGEDNHALYHVD